MGQNKRAYEADEYHAMRHYGPLMPGGGEFDKCDWCGRIENVVPQRSSASKKSSKQGQQHDHYSR